MPEGREAAFAKETANEIKEKKEQINKRWEAFKRLVKIMGTADVNEIVQDVELPEPNEWESWKDWDKIFELLGEYKEDEKYNDLAYSIIDKENSENLEINGLAIAFVTNPDFYNELRKRFTTETHKDEWDTFFKAYGKRIFEGLKNEYNRYRELNYRGYDFKGLDPTPFFDEFADLEGADLEGCDLSGYRFYKHMEFKNTNLKKVKFDGAAILNSRFDGADLEGATFYGAKIRCRKEDNCNLPDWAIEQAKMKRE